MLRRLKVEVEKSLPPKKETLLYVGLSEMQRKLYKQCLLKEVTVVTGASKEKVKLLNLVMQLRKVCNHPYLFDGVEDRTLNPMGDHLITNCGKLTLLDKLLPKLKARGSRVLIFSQMTRLLDILEDFCTIRNYGYTRIDGSSDYEERCDAMDSYNAPDSPLFIFLLSTRAGGLGINLTTADTVILYDSDWNPQMDLQAQDRAHRIGQTKPVNVYRLVSDHTIEEKVIERAEMKLRLDAVVIQQGRLAERNKALSKEEMSEMVRFGAEEVFRTGKSSIDDLDIDALLADGAERTKEMKEKFDSSFQKKDAESLLNFSLSGNLNYREFEGDDYSDPSSSTDTSAMDKELNEALARQASKALGQRERKKVQYNVNQYFSEALKVPKGTPKKKRVKKKRVPRAIDKRIPEVLQRPDNLHKVWKMFEYVRLNELYEKQQRAFLQHLESPNVDWETSAEMTADQVKKRNQDLALQKELLTPEEEAEKQRLLREGFALFSKFDVLLVVRTVAKYGRDHLDAACSEVSSTTEGRLSPEEVHRFLTKGLLNGRAEVFWGGQDTVVETVDENASGEEEGEKQKGDDEDDGEEEKERTVITKNPNGDIVPPEHSLYFPKLMSQIEAGEKKLIAQNKLFRNLRRRLNAAGGTLNALNPNLSVQDRENENAIVPFQVPKTAGKAFPWSEYNDLLSIALLDKLGCYGRWAEMQNILLQDGRLCFDYWARSRSDAQLRNRCESLMRHLSKNMKDEVRKAIKELGVYLKKANNLGLELKSTPKFDEMKENYREEIVNKLKAFYQRHNPARLESTDFIDKVIRKYNGRWDELINQLRSKYKLADGMEELREFFQEVEKSLDETLNQKLGKLKSNSFAKESVQNAVKQCSMILKILTSNKGIIASSVTSSSETQDGDEGNSGETKDANADSVVDDWKEEICDLQNNIALGENLLVFIGTKQEQILLQAERKWETIVLKEKTLQGELQKQVEAKNGLRSAIRQLEKKIEASLKAKKRVKALLIKEGKKAAMEKAKQGKKRKRENTKSDKSSSKKKKKASTQKKKIKKKTITKKKGKGSPVKKKKTVKKASSVKKKKNSSPKKKGKQKSSTAKKKKKKVKSPQSDDEDNANDENSVVEITNKRPTLLFRKDGDGKRASLSAKKKKKKKKKRPKTNHPSQTSLFKHWKRSPSKVATTKISSSST
eukprot:g3870.t1